MNMPVRKQLRLKEYDYSQNGVYFVTICTFKKKKILCDIVGDGVLDVPKIKLKVCGKIASRTIQAIDNIYSNITFDKYTIMPNHIHLLIRFSDNGNAADGSSRTPTPTARSLPDIISTFKRLSNKEYGQPIWQRNYYEHIVRNEEDYLIKWQYIDNNPSKWAGDEYYI